MEDYKSNSHKSKDGLGEKKKFDKIVTGSVKTKKKSEIRKLADVFVPEDVSSVKNFVLMDVIIPAAKKTIVDIVNAFLYPRGSSRGSSYGPFSVSYKKYSDTQDNGRSYRDRNWPRSNGYEHDDIILETRGEAEQVLSKMDEIVEMYSVVSVADLYDLVGKTGQYTDNKYGWTNIRNAEAIRVKEGYLIKLPKALPID